MKSMTRRFAIAAALAACGVAAQAQMPPAPPSGMPHAGMQQHMQERMQERMQRRMESLKRILQITPQQEGAWSNWVAAMRPNPGNMEQRHRMHEEMERMSTPERIDRMRQMRAQRAAEMDRKGDATKAFYSQLTPPQQKAFDEISMRFFGHGRGHGKRHG